MDWSDDFEKAMQDDGDLLKSDVWEVAYASYVPGKHDWQEQMTLVTAVSEGHAKDKIARAHPGSVVTMIRLTK